MAKFKSAGSKKAAAPTKSALSAIPCLLLVVLGIALISLMLYFSLQSSAPQ